MFLGKHSWWPEASLQPPVVHRGLSGYVGEPVVNCSIMGESCFTEAQFGGFGRLAAGFWFLDGIFHEKNQVAIGVALWLWKPPYQLDFAGEKSYGQPHGPTMGFQWFAALSGVSRQLPVKFHPWIHAEWTSVPVGVRWAAGGCCPSQVWAISMGAVLRIYCN